jgi:hypothetical protein
MKMKTYWVVVGIAMAAGRSAQAEECTVTAYVRAGFTWSALVRRAEGRATGMFREIGVAVRFRNGVADRANAADDACGTPIVLIIDSEAGGQPASEHALAYATPYSKSGTSIHIFMDRIGSGRNPYFETVLLAHVLVHELTHVLEGIARHSEDGIMKARWNSLDEKLMRSHPLPFTALDVDLIHTGITRRTQTTVTE